jgi:hypothetical protein
MDGKLHAVTASGEKNWVFAAQAGIYATPAAGSDGTMYLGAGDGILYANWRMRMLLTTGFRCTKRYLAYHDAILAVTLAAAK